MMKSNVATEEYTNLVYETSRKRITLAGYRLANFVISIFGQQNATNSDSFKNTEELEKIFISHAKQNEG